MPPTDARRVATGLLNPMSVPVTKQPHEPHQQMSSTLPPELADLSVSAKFVYRELQTAGPCSQAELRARTLLPDRTVRRALDDLEGEKVVEKFPSGDGRAPLYDINEE